VGSNVAVSPVDINLKGNPYFYIVEHVNHRVLENRSSKQLGKLFFAQLASTFQELKRFDNLLKGCIAVRQEFLIDKELSYNAHVYYLDLTLGDTWKDIF